MKESEDGVYNYVRIFVPLLLPRLVAEFTDARDGKRDVPC